jgi:hypothetical protein
MLFPKGKFFVRRIFFVDRGGLLLVKAIVRVLVV